MRCRTRLHVIKNMDKRRGSPARHLLQHLTAFICEASFVLLARVQCFRFDAFARLHPSVRAKMIPPLTLPAPTRAPHRPKANFGKVRNTYVPLIHSQSFSYLCRHQTHPSPSGFIWQWYGFKSPCPISYDTGWDIKNHLTSTHTQRPCKKSPFTPAPEKKNTLHAVSGKKR